MQQEFASRLLEEAVTELSRLPGIGRKTALRLALHILRADESAGVALGQSIIDMRKGEILRRMPQYFRDGGVPAVCRSTAR